MTVYHRGLGIENSAKIVSVTYDVLLERYQAMTVGDVRTNLTDTMRAISAEINKDNPTVSAIKNAISHATTIISGGLGGNVVINTNEDGQPIEILAMNTIDEWLEQFEMFSIYEILPEILDLWGTNLITDVQSKKNSKRAAVK